MTEKTLYSVPPSAPLPYSPAVEKVEPDENETIASLVETLRGITETTSKDNHHALRAVHAKSTGLVGGELTVFDNIPPVLAQGLFAHPGHYPVILRFSTAPGDLIADSISAPRGLGIKVIGGDGAGMPLAKGDTQDFVLVNGPAFLAPTPKAFLKSLKQLAGTTDKAEGAKKVLAAALRGAESVVEAFGGESATLKSLGGHPITNPLGETYFSQTAFRYGDFIAKFSLAPVSPELIALTDAPVDLHGDENGLRSALLDFFGKHAAKWELRVQLCTDLDSMPVEDASAVWPVDKSPYISVAHIEAGPQIAWSPERATAVDDGVAFSPWNALAAHRPLGGVNRARKPTYEMSSAFRGGRNGCPIHGATMPKDFAGLR